MPFCEIPNFLMFAPPSLESNALSLGSSLPMGAGGHSVFSYEDSGTFCSGNSWDLNNCFFNPPNSVNMHSGSDLSVYPSEQESDLLFGNDSEFLQQIDGCTPVMHPNLVIALKKMVGPGPGGGSPRGGPLFEFDQLLQQHDVTHQSDNISNNNNNNLQGSPGAFFVQCSGSLSPDSSQRSQTSCDGAKSVISSVAASESSAISQPSNIISTHQQPLKV